MQKISLIMWLGTYEYEILSVEDCGYSNFHVSERACRLSADFDDPLQVRTNSVTTKRNCLGCSGNSAPDGYELRKERRYKKYEDAPLAYSAARARCLQDQGELVTRLERLRDFQALEELGNSKFIRN